MKTLSQQKHIIKCSDIEPHLFDFIQHELGQVQTTVITEHLKKCEKCKKSLHELQESLKTLEDFGINKPPEHLTDKRKKKINFRKKQLFQPQLVILIFPAPGTGTFLSPFRGQGKVPGAGKNEV